MTPGGRIDPARAFTPLAIAVLTISDSRDATSDTSGDLLAERIGAAGHAVGARALVRDDKSLIQQQLRRWIDDPSIDVVITTGGTGLTGRDVTPEATLAIADRQMPGFGEQKARIFVALLGKQYSVTPKGWRKAAGDYGKAGTHLSVADIADARSLDKVRSYKRHQKEMKAAKKGNAAT